MNTGNNLLYLLLGSMLGFIAVSSWLSEQAIRALRVERRGPRSVTVGHDLRLTYEVRNRAFETNVGNKDHTINFEN